MQRRQFLFSAISPALLRAAPTEPQTRVYKNADGCEIKADIFAPIGSGRKPVAVSIHGGALIMGSRKLPPDARVLRALLDAGFGVVSIDYRLAPETKLPAIIEDVQDAFRWIRANSPEFRLDPDRLAVCGGSAGGYLTLMTGFAVTPKPKALAPFWGYGEIAGAWYARFKTGNRQSRGRRPSPPSAARPSPSLLPETIAAGSTFTAGSEDSGLRRWPATILQPRTRGSPATLPRAT